MKKKILAMFLVITAFVSALGLKDVKAGTNKADAEYAIYIEENEGGVLTVDHKKAKAGQKVTFHVKENAGYDLQAVYLDDKLLKGDSFIMPDRGVVLTPVFVKAGVTYSIKTTPSRNGKFTLDAASAQAGDKVVVDYHARNGYVLDSVMLNGKKTKLDKQNTFTMPGEDVIVSVSFQKAIKEADVVVRTENANSTGTSYWYFEYTPSVFYITVKVIDATVIGTGKAEYQDYVECMLNLYQEGVTSWQYGKTVKYTVTAGGQVYKQTAAGALAFGRVSETEEDFSYSVEEKQIMEKDGYSGYEVRMKIPYKLLGTTYEEAKGKILVCPAYRNSESLVTRRWSSAYDWFDVSKHYQVEIK